jgi:hypothetical protein
MEEAGQEEAGQEEAFRQLPTREDASGRLVFRSSISLRKALFGEDEG